LLRRRERDYVGGVLEAAGLNHTMEQFGLQARDRFREVRRLEKTREQAGFRHGAAIVLAALANKQSCSTGGAAGQ
jgi:hypothetical protein